MKIIANFRLWFLNVLFLSSKRLYEMQLYQHPLRLDGMTLQVMLEEQR